MSDPVPAADDAAKQQQLQLLQAIAEQGTRGKAFYAQQQADAQAQKEAAVTDALSRASSQGGPGTSGAPVSLQSQLGAQAAVPGNEQGAYLSAGQTAFNQDQQALTNANDSYMGQLRAAIPLVAQRSQAALDQRRIDAQLARDSAQAVLEGHRIANDTARQQAALQSVSERKYADQQAQQANQQQIIDQAQQSGSTGRAFLQILQANHDLPSALADLQAGAQPPPDLGFGRLRQSDFTKMFGPDADPAAVAQLLNAYYSHPSTAAATAPGTGVGAAIAGF